MGPRPVDVPIRPSHRHVAARPHARPSSAGPRLASARPSARRGPPPAPGGERARRPRSADQPGRYRGISATAVAAVAVAAGLLVRVAGADAPGRGRDEGALVAAAWRLGRALPGPDPVTPVHPSLATWQLAAWDRITGAFDRAPSAVAGGREATALALAATVVLTWALARRVGLTRWAAVPGVAIVALSPLAAGLFGTVQPGALAAPWLVGALVLARASRGRVALAHLAAGALLAVAVLTAPIAALAAPGVAFQAWRAARPSRRTAALGLAAAGAAIVAVPGWLLVLDGTTAVTGAGGLVGLGQRLARTFGEVATVDPLTVGVVAVGAVLAPLATRRLRPLALAFWPLALVALRPSTPPTVALSLALPFGAVLVGGAAEALWSWTDTTRRERRVTVYRASAGVHVLDGLAPATLAVLALAGVAAVPRWLPDRVDGLTADDDASVRAAADWVADNVDDGARLVVDEGIWLDVVVAGHDPAAVVAYDRVPGSLLDHDHVVLVPGALVGRSPTDPLVRAVATSPAVAAFGDGGDRTEVRRLAGDDPPPDPMALDAADAGTALATNGRLTLTPEADALLRAGGVDERVLTLLATVAVDHRVSVAGFPLPAAEAAAHAPARTVEIAAVDDQPVRADSAGVVDVTSFLERQDGWYRPATVGVAAGRGGRAVLRVVYPPA